MTIRQVSILLFGIAALELCGAGVHHQTGMNPLMLIGVLRCAETLWMIGQIRQFQGGLSLIGLSAGSICAGIREGLKATVAVGVLTFSVHLVLRYFGYSLIAALAPGSVPGLSRILALLAIGGLLAPIAEEVLFRGVIFACLHRYATVTKIVISALCFAGVHLAEGFNPTHIAGGFLFGVVYARYQKLSAAMVVHCAGNCAIFISGWLHAAGMLD